MELNEFLNKNNYPLDIVEIIKNIVDGSIEMYQKLNEEFRVLREAIEDPAASELGKEKRAKEADAKLAEIRELEQSINDYDNTTRTQITETQNRMKKNIVREIRETVAGIARKDNYNMVLDIAALARTDTPIVLYHDGSADITEKVLTQMNAGAPVSETP